MMTAKLHAQAVPTAGESDPFTHETPARIVFGDWKGFNFGDSIIISKSFARKLRSNKSRKIHLNLEQWNYLKEKYSAENQASSVTGSSRTIAPGKEAESAAVVRTSAGAASWRM